MYISHIHIKNVLCFKEIDISLEKNGQPCLWNMVLGDNSSGKTGLLRCIAIGLCDEASAGALMKELEGNLRRKKTRRGEISLTLKDPASPADTLKIVTKIRSEHGSEIIEKEYGERYSEFRDRIFLCGYGVQRAGDADLSFRKYSMLEAVYTLFNYVGKLQNPELILRRHGLTTREAFFRKLEKVLMLDVLDKSQLESIDYRLRLLRRGVVIEGPWGRMLLDEMSDGYFSTFTWLVDFIGWQTYANPKWLVSEELGGIVLLDEIELHLHPSWQRYIVHRLAEHFPEVQFIVTTHSPIAAAGASDFPDSNLIILKLRDGKVDLDETPPSLQGMRFDEILTSPAFGLFAVKSPKSVEAITRLGELERKERNLEEEVEYDSLVQATEKALPPGESVAQRIAKKAIRKALPEILRDLTEEVSKESIEQEIQTELGKLLGA